MTGAAAPILVTGATGFLGKALCPLLTAQGMPVRPAGRGETGDIGPQTDWRRLVDGVDTVIHLAARAHIMRDRAADPLAEFQRVNTAATASLARAAADAGVKRFVFISTVKVQGETSDHALTAGDPAAPRDPYAISKWQAEQGLADHAGAFDLVVLRPPLVYGPGVRGNFLTLLRAVDRGWPLPFGRIDNRRSLIHRGNLADAIRAALSVPPGVYLPSDREDLSTPGMIRRLADALGRRARLIDSPPGLLRIGATLAGRGAALDRLAGSLTVDGVLPGWTPPHTVAEGFAETARWYRENEGGNP
jgi:nucleoside-diphosphate-sugar epimerase